MRKVLIVSFIISIIVCLVGCSKTDNSSTSATVAVTETIKSTEEATEEFTEAPTEEATIDDSWKQAYLKYFNSEGNLDYFEYALVYIDDDDIPELYKHGKQRPSSSFLCWIYNDEVYSQGLMIDGFGYYNKDNVFMTTGIQAGTQGDFIYRINGAEAKTIEKGTASRVIKGQERFIWNGEEVSEERYNELRAETFDSTKANTVDKFIPSSEIIAYIENY